MMDFHRLMQYCPMNQPACTVEKYVKPLNVFGRVMRSHTGVGRYGVIARTAMQIRSIK